MIVETLKSNNRTKLIEFIYFIVNELHNDNDFVNNIVGIYQKQNRDGVSIFQFCFDRNLMKLSDLLLNLYLNRGKSIDSLSYVNTKVLLHAINDSSSVENKLLLLQQCLQRYNNDEMELEMKNNIILVSNRVPLWFDTLFIDETNVQQDLKVLQSFKNIKMMDIHDMLFHNFTNFVKQKLRIQYGRLYAKYGARSDQTSKTIIREFGALVVNTIGGNIHCQTNTIKAFGDNESRCCADISNLRQLIVAAAIESKQMFVHLICF